MDFFKAPPKSTNPFLDCLPSGGATIRLDEEVGFRPPLNVVYMEGFEKGFLFVGRLARTAPQMIIATIKHSI